MTREELIKKVEGNYSKEQVKAWVMSLPSNSKQIPLVPIIGDVYYHPIFNHPYVLLCESNNRGWICGLLTSNEDCEELLVKCSSRIFYNSYFTKTMFIVIEPKQFLGTFENNAQLSSVYLRLREELEN
jgi:hypothetical protein